MEKALFWSPRRMRSLFGGVCGRPESGDEPPVRPRVPRRLHVSLILFLFSLSKYSINANSPDYFYSTPWLVRRRRTCPICKGDVVRSMGHGTSSSFRQPGETRSDNVQTSAAESVNRSPSAAIPIPRPSDDGDEDVERGTDTDTEIDSSSAPLRGGTSYSNIPRNAPRMAWRSLASLNLSALSGDTAVWRQSPIDRNR